MAIPSSHHTVHTDIVGADTAYSDDGERPGKVIVHSQMPDRLVSRQNAIIIFARTPQIVRTNPNEPYATLPWEDLDSLFTAILGDLIEHTFQSGDVDVLLYRNPLEFSDEFLQPFRARVKCFDMQDGSIFSQVPGVLEQAFTLHYGRVVVLLENHPLVSPALLTRIFAQLGREDDGIVVGQSPDGQAYLLGVKSNRNAFLDSPEIDLLSKPERLLQAVCLENSMVFSVPSRFPLDSGTNLARLRVEIEEMQEGDAGFPHRTLAMFKSFDKKYKLRKPNR